MSKTSAIARDQAVVRYQAGESLNTLAKKHGVTVNAVRGWLKRRGVTLRTKAQAAQVALKHGRQRCFEKGPKHPAWKGGRVVSYLGYVWLLRPGHHRASKDGYVAEHVLVMERTLGRDLLAGEVVHHQEEQRLGQLGGVREPARARPDTLTGWGSPVWAGMSREESESQAAELRLCAQCENRLLESDLLLCDECGEWCCHGCWGLNFRCPVCKDVDNGRGGDGHSFIMRGQ